MREFKERINELIELFYDYYKLISSIIMEYFKINIFLDLVVLKTKDLKNLLYSIWRRDWTLIEWLDYLAYKYTVKKKINKEYYYLKNFIWKLFYFTLTSVFIYLIFKSNHEFYPSLHIYYSFKLYFLNKTFFIFLKTSCLVITCCFLLILPTYFGSEAYYKNIKNYNQFYWGTPQAKKTIKWFLMKRFYPILLAVVTFILLIIYIFL
jgi:hypothetical protein